MKNFLWKDKVEATELYVGFEPTFFRSVVDLSLDLY